MDSRKVLGFAAVLVIIACGSWLFFFYRSAPQPGEPVTALRPAACAACGKAYAAEFGAEPAKCSKCGADELWQAIKCSNASCGTVFPRKRGKPGARIAITCPKCGGTLFGEVGPNDLQN